MPLQTPEALLFTFFSCTQTTLTFVFLLTLALFSLTLLLDSVLFLFSLALFSLRMPEQTLSFLFLFDPLPPLDMLGGLSMLLLLLALRCGVVSFSFLPLACSGLLVLVMPLFGLLLAALLDPTLGWLGNSIGLFGPLFCHHASLGHLFPTDHCRLDSLLACHQHA